MTLIENALYKALVFAVILVPSLHEPAFAQDTLPVAAWEVVVRHELQDLLRQRPDVRVVFEAAPERGPEVAAVIRETAHVMGAVVGTRAQHLQCEMVVRPPYDKEVKRCSMSPGEVLVGVRVKSMSADSAIVEVSTVSPYRGAISYGGARYLLKRDESGWSVEKKLLAWAS